MVDGSTDIFSYLTHNPLILIGALGIGLIFLFYKFNKPSKPEPIGREFLVRETKRDLEETKKVLGQKARDAEIWQGMKYVGTIETWTEQPAQLIDDKVKNVKIDKVKKVYTFHLFKENKFLSIDIGKIMAKLANKYIVLIIDSDSLEIHRNEDTELLTKAMNQQGAWTDNYQIWRIKPDVFIETHVGITIVNSQIVQDYVRSINWKILHEEAQGEYLLTPRKFAYFDKNTAKTVEIADAQSNIEQNAKDKSIKRYVGN